MADGEDTVSKAHMRLNHTEEDIREIKADVKANHKLIVSVCIDLAGLKTEMRIFGGVMLAILIALAVNAIAGA